jgi:hypothetical protein
MTDTTLTITIEPETDELEAAIDDAIERIEAPEAALDRVSERIDDVNDALGNDASLGVAVTTDACVEPVETMSGAGESIAFDDMADHLTGEIDRRHQEGR